MRLRCPHHGCPIDVEDDMLGARIRCPQCGELLFVKESYRADAGEPGVPSLSLDPEPKPEAPDDLEDRVYAGVPPLSLMLAIREGRGPGRRDEEIIRRRMTPEDWEALAAFEAVLHALAALKLALVCDFLAAGLTVAVWFAFNSAYAQPSPGQVFSRLATFTVLGGGLFLMYQGRDSLKRLRPDAWVGRAVWAGLGVGLTCVANVALNVLVLVDGRHEQGLVCLVFLATPFQLAAAATAVLAAWRIPPAQERLRPPDVLQRLTEALGHLKRIPGF
jgi:DNA-directed RNA polymerase subunit RPC12/RpoP